MKFLVLGPTRSHDALNALVRCIGRIRNEKCTSRTGSLADADDDERVIMYVNDYHSLKEARHLAAHGFNGRQTVVLVGNTSDVGTIRHSDSVNVLACTLTDDPSTIEDVARMILVRETSKSIAA